MLNVKPEFTIIKLKRIIKELKLEIEKLKSDNEKGG
jgi:hypothetical protein